MVAKRITKLSMKSVGNMNVRRPKEGWRNRCLRHERRAKKLIENNKE